MTGGDNISNIKAMYNREQKYLDIIKGIKNELIDIEQQPLPYVSGAINGLIDYLEGILDE